MKVRTQTNLVKRNGVLYLRMKVPSDIKAHYPKKSIRKSLGKGTTHQEAKGKVIKLLAQYEAEFAAIRERLKPAVAEPLTLGMIPAIAKALEGHILAADEEIRAGGLDDEEFTRWESETAAVAAEVSRAYARGDSSPIDAALEDWLNSLGIDAAKDSPEFKTLRREFLKARLKALQGKLARNRGEIVETPQGPSVESLQESIRSSQAHLPVVAAAKGGPRLSSVISYWKGVGAKSHRTTDTADMMVKVTVLAIDRLMSRTVGIQRFPPHQGA